MHNPKNKIELRNISKIVIFEIILINLYIPTINYFILLFLFKYF